MTFEDIFKGISKYLIGDENSPNSQYFTGIKSPEIDPYFTIPNSSDKKPKKNSLYSIGLGVIGSVSSIFSDSLKKKE